VKKRIDVALDVAQPGSNVNTRLVFHVNIYMRDSAHKANSPYCSFPQPIIALVS